MIIRGARQVGKTTLLKQLGGYFNNFIPLNLEQEPDRRVFEEFRDPAELVRAIFFNRNIPLAEAEQTLLFLDEVQGTPSALGQLRYINEQFPGLSIVAAGSMLETVFDNRLSFPVGRVLRPCSFPEFLSALGETSAAELLQTVPLPAFAMDKLYRLFHLYAVVGGMPAIVQRYTETGDLTVLREWYDSLIASYLDDVEKYGRSDSQVQVIRLAIRGALTAGGKRITFAGFGNTLYRSREMSDALNTLQKAMLIQLVYPVTSAVLPLTPDRRKSPRLQFLDTGLMNYYSGIQKELFGTSDLSSAYQGRIIEHLVGQELLALQHEALGALNFWVREKASSTAEVDFLFPHDGTLIPVEVKSGGAGKLRSLHLFMDQSPHDLAIRFHHGPVTMTETATPAGKKFRLLNLPYFLVSGISAYIRWAG
jgi:hypothetical protein